MAFSRTWNAAYEAQPADTENISIGASRIRDLKTDIQERLVVDHSHAGDADDGKHKQVTFGPIPLVADPANLANHGFLYTKDVSGKVELHWIDEDGNVIALTAVGSINAFPAGTSMIFHQTSAPAGWTKQSINDKALRVVNGTASSGGANTFSTVFGTSKTTGSHILGISEIPAHEHDVGVAGAGGSPGGDYLKNTTSGFTNSGRMETVGGGGGHNHTMTMDLQFEDIIIADKD